MCLFCVHPPCKECYELNKEKKPFDWLIHCDKCIEMLKTDYM